MSKAALSLPALVAIITSAAVSTYHQAALKILVIQGDNAVNIIQQKTAIAPIVEIRDRNDLPVSGVPVTFTISGENAVFGGGLRTISVTTNAAGRAAVDTLTAVASGPVRVTASATVQGQTVTATMTQANFATAAQAAQAGSAGGGGGSAGAASAGGAVATTGGAVGAGAATAGGLGAGAIAAIAGGVGGGALAATKLAGGGNGSDGDDGGGGARSGGNQACAFTVSPTALTAEASGGTRAINVTTPPGCSTTPWTASSNMDWVTFDVASGTGTGTVTATIAPNQPFTAPRSGSVVVATQAIDVAQARGCEFTVEPRIVNLPGTGGSAAVTVTPLPSGCTPSPWTTQPAQNSNFITLSPTGGSGGMTVTVTVTPNPTPFAGRSDAVIIAGAVVSVRQAAGPGGI